MPVEASAIDGGGAGSAPWTDRKRHLWMLGVLVPVLPVSGWLLADVTGLGLFWWWGPIFVFGIIPLLDVVVGNDSENPPEELIDQLQNDRYYRVLTFLYIPAQFASLIFAAYAWANFDLSTVDKVGLAFTVGAVNGIAINTAHELGHRHEKLEQRLSILTLAPTIYGHFFVEHNRGHHTHVATPNDPASSRMGESFYRFLPRTMVGSVVSAWKLESKRLERTGYPTFSPHNTLFRAWGLSVVLFVGLCVAFGVGILPFLLLQAFYGASLLEVVNYLEHYGLLRAQREDGRYVRCMPEHSWNSNILTSNLFLYQLQRHSDHHAYPTRRYQSLRHYDDVPQLPGGYASMIPLAYVPPLWRRIMDRRVVEHYDGDVTRAHIHPPARERVLAQWGASAG